MKSTLTRGLLLASASTLAVTLSACGSDETSAASDSSAPDSSSSSASESSGSMESSSTMAEPAGDEPFGAGCTAVPADGEVQTEERARPFPNGASGLHSIRVIAT